MFKEALVAPEEALTAVDDRGRPLPAVIDVLRLVAEADAVLATGHLSPEECAALVGEALRCGVQRIWLTHPFSRLVRMPLPQVGHLLSLSASVWVEFTANDCSQRQREPIPRRQVAEWIRSLGAERVVVTSDGGQPENPPPHELLAWMLDGLVDAGLSEADVALMVKDNPRRLLM
jgi:hypothetical protein